MAFKPMIPQGEIMVHINSWAGASTVCCEPGGSSEQAKPSVGAGFASGLEQEGPSGTQELTELVGKGSVPCESPLLAAGLLLEGHCPLP